MLSDKNVRNYYIEKFPKILLTDLNATWVQTSKDTNSSTGKLKDSVSAVDYQVGQFTASQLKYIEPGAMIKFEAPAGKHFMADGSFMSGEADHLGSKTYIWTAVVSVYNDCLLYTSPSPRD